RDRPLGRDLPSELLLPRWCPACCARASGNAVWARSRPSRGGWRPEVRILHVVPVELKLVEGPPAKDFQSQLPERLQLPGRESDPSSTVGGRFYLRLVDTFLGGRIRLRPQRGLGSSTVPPLGTPAFPSAHSTMRAATASGGRVFSGGSASTEAID